MDTLTTPEAKKLAAAVAAAYDVFGGFTVSAGLQVCTCPVCMTKDTRQAIVRTPARELTPLLIGEYSNSAHGVPDNTDDLKALLPRYLDLIAQGEPVDQNQVGCELARFGDAVRDGSLVFSEAEAAALDRWMRALVHHAARCRRKDVPFETPVYWFEVLICGGWSLKDVLATYDALFDAPGTGKNELARFATDLEEEIAWYGPRIWYALGRVPEADKQTVADWLNSPAMKTRLEAAFLADLPEAACEALYAMLDRCGSFETGSFGFSRNPA